MDWRQVTRDCWDIEVVSGSGVGATISRRQGWKKQGLTHPFRVEFLGNNFFLTPFADLEEAQRATKEALQRHVHAMGKVLGPPPELA